MQRAQRRERGEVQREPRWAAEVRPVVAEAVRREAQAGRLPDSVHVRTQR